MKLAQLVVLLWSILGFGLIVSDEQQSLLTLQFIEPKQVSYVQSNILIPIYVTVKNLPNATGTAGIKLSCLPVEFEYKTTVTLNVESFITIPSSLYGECVLSAKSDICPLPTYLPITISVQLYFVNPPTIIFEGQVFNITIAATGTPPDSLDTNLILFCPGALYSWKNVALNKLVTLQTPLNLPQSKDCYFNTSPGLFLVQPNSTQVTVSDVPLKFVQPIDSSFTQDQLVPILVIAVNYPEIRKNIIVSWVCASASYNNASIPMEISVEQEFEIPPNVFGKCVLSIENPPLGFISPVPATFNVAWNLSMSNYPQIIYPSQLFPILIEPTLPAALANSTSVTLNCKGSQVQTWTDVPFSILVNLMVDPTVEASENCYLATETATNYVIDAISSPITVGLIELVFEEPVANSTTIIPSGFPLLISTPLNSSISYSSAANLYCSFTNSTLIIPFTSNLEYTVEYPNCFYGPCTLSIPDYWPYFNPPTPIAIFLKFDLQFKVAPKTITRGEPFLVEISATGDVPVNTVNLCLVCLGEIIETWPDLDLSQPQVLQFTQTGTALFSCNLEAGANDIFTAAISPVIIVNPKSPFGSNYVFVSPLYVKQFLSNVSSASRWEPQTFP